MRSRGHFEEEVESQEEEDEVGGPSSEERGELADAAHGFGESSEGPVGDADTDAESDTADGAAAANEKGEGDGEHHTDGRDERVGDFLVPLDVEGGDIEAGIAEAIDVVAKAAPTHLKSLADFAIEIGGSFGEFGESGDFERGVAFDPGIGEIADPAGFENPGFFCVEPASLLGEDATLHLKRDRIKFDDGETAEELLRRVEEVVVIDF